MRLGIRSIPISKTGEKGARMSSRVNGMYRFGGIETLGQWMDNKGSKAQKYGVVYIDILDGLD